MTKPLFIDSILADLFGEARPTRWATRERPKIDRIACPWLIRRFIDPGAEFLFIPTADVLRVASREKAVAFAAGVALIRLRANLIAVIAACAGAAFLWRAVV